MSWEVGIGLAGILSGLATSIVALYYGPKKQEEARIKSEKELRIWRRKDVVYNKLTTNITGFFEGDKHNSPEMKAKRVDFLDAYRFLWLYGTDENIQKTNKYFISQGYDKQNESDVERSFRDVMYSMRKEYYPRTALSPKDYYFPDTK